MKFVFISHGIPKGLKEKVSQMVGKKPTEIKVLYITTPANTYPGDAPWLIEAINDIKNQGFQITQMDIAKEDSEDIRSAVFTNDIVWVSGGNTFYFLYWANKKGLKEILVDYLNKGGVYAGESAGVVCQIKDLEPIKWADNPAEAPEIVNEGMQLTDVVALPHWGFPKYAKVMDRIRDYYVKQGIKPYLLKDGEALVIEDGKVGQFK